MHRDWCLWQTVIFCPLLQWLFFFFFFYTGDINKGNDLWSIIPHKYVFDTGASHLHLIPPLFQAKPIDNMSVYAFKVKSRAKQEAIFFFLDNISPLIWENDSSAQEEVGGRRQICVDDAVRRTGVILEFHTALRRASHPQMHASSWMRLNHKMSTASTLSDKQPHLLPCEFEKRHGYYNKMKFCRYIPRFCRELLRHFIFFPLRLTIYYVTMTVGLWHKLETAKCLMRCIPHWFPWQQPLLNMFFPFCCQGHSR